MSLLTGRAAAMIFGGERQVWAASNKVADQSFSRALCRILVAVAGKRASCYQGSYLKKKKIASVHSIALRIRPFARQKVLLSEAFS